MNISHRPFHGLVAAAYTPMNPDGSANTAVIPAYARLLAGNGIGAVFICGSTGESLSLTVEDRLAVAEEWIKHQTPEFRVIVHVGHNSLKVACQLARHAASIGASAISCMAPAFFKPAKLEHLIDWCAAVAEAGAPCPFYYYHLPIMTGARMPMVDFLVEGSARIPTLAGIKYTHDDLEEFAKCLKVEDGRFDIPFGFDEFLVDSLALGGKGAIGSSYNFASPLYLEIIRAYHAGESDLARDLQQRAIRMIETIAASEVGYLPSAKNLMKDFGVDCGSVLPPLANPTLEQKATLRANLEAINFKEYACVTCAPQTVAV